MAEQFALDSDGTLLRGEVAGEGTPVLLAHGLTATRRYVLLGSRALERSGHAVISYDARGHGSSAPAADGAYGYPQLSRDMAAVLDHLGVERAVLVGASMGAHTAVRFAREAPQRVAALALITPAFDPLAPPATAGWDALARGLRDDGVDGFVAAYDLAAVPERWRETVERVLRQRLAAHRHPLAVADALERVPRSRPFERWPELGEIAAPALIVASRDEADPGHPLAIGERWARELAAAHLVVEEPGGSPLAWQGGRLSALVAALAAETA